MKNKIKILLLLFVLTTGITAAQPDSGPDPEMPIASRTIDQQNWEKASEGLDYSKDLPKPPKQKKQQTGQDRSGFQFTDSTRWLGILLQVLVVAAALLGLGYFVYYLVQQPRNKQISRDGVEITLDNLEEYLQESDLDRFLREALKDQNYPLAIRLYFLQVIKQLSAQNAIQWSREKTNRDYLREMRNHARYPEFQYLTKTFERIWYGNAMLQADTFQQLEPDFKRFLAQA